MRWYGSCRAMRAGGAAMKQSSLFLLLTLMLNFLISFYTVNIMFYTVGLYFLIVQTLIIILDQGVIILC